jgi:hypothetical protein
MRGQHLLRRLEDVATRWQLADRRRVAPSVVFRQFERMRIRYRRRVEPFIEAAKAVRDNIAAHHGRNTAWPESRYGRVFRLAARTIVLVDQIHLLANDERSNIQNVVRDVRWQTAAAWPKGIGGGCPLRRLPDGRGRGAKGPVRENPAADRRTATTTGPSVGPGRSDASSPREKCV